MERARGLLIEKTFGSAMLPPLLRDLIDRAETEKKAMKTEESAHVGGKIDSIRDDDAFLSTHRVGRERLRDEWCGDPVGGE